VTFRFLLDTNIISEINKKIPNKLVVDKFITVVEVKL